MAPLQSKDMKYVGANNYMPAPVLSPNGDMKQGIMPSAPSADVDMDGAGSITMIGHGPAAAMPMIADHQQRRMSVKPARRRSNAFCAGVSIFLVIFCCVITGLEVSVRKLSYN